MNDLEALLSELLERPLMDSLINTPVVIDNPKNMELETNNENVDASIFHDFNGSSLTNNPQPMDRLISGLPNWVEYTKSTRSNDHPTDANRLIGNQNYRANQGNSINDNQSYLPHNALSNGIGNPSYMVSFPQTNLQILSSGTHRTEFGQIIDNQNYTNNMTLVPSSTNGLQRCLPNNGIGNPSNSVIFFPENSEKYRTEVNNQNARKSQVTYMTPVPFSTNDNQNQLQHENNPAILSNSYSIDGHHLINYQPTPNTNFKIDSTLPIFKIFDLIPTSWVPPSRKLSKKHKTPKIHYRPREGMVPEGADLYIYYDLFEMPNVTLLKMPMPRISPHHIKIIKEKKENDSSPVEPMAYDNCDGFYHFQMPFFMLNKNNSKNHRLHMEWFAKYMELFENTGTIEELSPQSCNNDNAFSSNSSNFETKIENLISEHLDKNTNIYKYVVLGFYICVKNMDSNSTIRYRKIDGPFYSEILETLQKEIRRTCKSTVMEFEN